MCRTCQEWFPALPYLSIPATFHRGNLPIAWPLKAILGPDQQAFSGGMLKYVEIDLPLKKLLISPYSKDLLRNMTRTCVKDPT